MKVRARAPVRIDFAGGWSDVWDFADENGGAVANAAIDLYTHVRCSCGGGVYRLRATDVDLEITAPSIGALRHDGRLDLHKAALAMLPVSGGAEIVTRSDVPPGSGLGASGSLDVALLAALSACRGEATEAAELAEMGFLLETAQLGLRGGRQDQYAAALGGFQAIAIGGGAGVASRPLAVSPEAAAELERHLALVYTGESHFSSETHVRVWDAYHRGDIAVADAIVIMRDLVRPVVAALEAGRWRELAALVSENWLQQQRLDPAIATERMRRIERSVRDQGAWGVKALGAGAGGCMLVLHAREDLSRLRAAAAADRARLLDWHFTFEGVRTWQDDAADDPG